MYVIRTLYAEWVGMGVTLSDYCIAPTLQIVTVKLMMNVVCKKNEGNDHLLKRDCCQQTQTGITSSSYSCLTLNNISQYVYIRMYNTPKEVAKLIIVQTGLNLDTTRA